MYETSSSVTAGFAAIHGLFDLALRATRACFSRAAVHRLQRATGEPQRLAVFRTQLAL